MEGICIVFLERLFKGGNGAVGLGIRATRDEVLDVDVVLEKRKFRVKGVRYRIGRRLEGFEKVCACRPVRSKAIGSQQFPR